MKKHIWVMPERRDEKFTNTLIDQIVCFAGDLGICNLQLEIKEQYENEDTPHYHFLISSGPCQKSLSAMSPTDMVATYLATKGDETHEGRVRLTFRALSGGNDKHKMIVAGAFCLYVLLIRKFYPERKTIYDSTYPPS